VRSVECWKEKKSAEFTWLNSEKVIKENQSMLCAGNGSLIQGKQIITDSLEACLRRVAVLSEL
jgi:hypothetical protein